MSGLRIERPGEGVAMLVLDRPERLNALDDSLLLEALPGALASLGSDASVRAVVITGAGRAFCAGADLECTGFTQPTATDAEAYMRRSHLTPLRVRALDVPTVAALHGAVVGAGLGLALACDFRFTGPELRMGSPFVTMGLVPDFGVSYFLPRIVGAERALDLLLTGRLVDAAEALALGLVSRCCDDVVAEAVAFAATLAAAPPAAVAATRRNVYRSLELSLDGELEQEVRAQSLALFGSEFPGRFAAWKQQVRGGG
ncbi:MAG TPA: enoyl-CoA hydratase/isomerase family protein [Acidimicrobiales bacterium]